MAELQLLFLDEDECEKALRFYLDSFGRGVPAEAKVTWLTGQEIFGGAHLEWSETDYSDQERSNG